MDQGRGEGGPGSPSELAKSEIKFPEGSDAERERFLFRLRRRAARPPPHLSVEKGVEDSLFVGMHC